MMLNLFLGIGIMLVCLFLQALLVAVSVRVYGNNAAILQTPSFFSTVGLIAGVMLVLVMGNLLQISIWGALFIYLGEFGDFKTAFYHSAVNFATLGYGDIVMSDQHRILGPMQAVNGVLMVGVSTAVVMSTLQDAMQKTREARQQVAGRESSSGIKKPSA